MPQAPLHRLPLKAAVSEIYRGGISRNGSGYESPFFFLIGAGVSAPAIPLASKIEAECRDLALEEEPTLSCPANLNPQASYSFWIERAHPHPRQQQQFFRKKMQGRSISPATLRLAHLLCADGPPKMVVTPNFDDFLSRAVRLFGGEPVICDHPATTSRVDLNSNDIQIIHVHGTYWFYDLVNLDDHIRERSVGSEATTQTMRHLLEALLRHRSPLVIGYSGWEDVIMRALQQRLEGQLLPHRMYWFCYSEADLERLPGWLKGHRSVCFVLPETELQPADAATTPRPAAPSGQDSSAWQPEEQPARLSAEMVFEEMLRAWKTGPPSLTRDPLQHFIDQLERVAPTKDTTTRTESAYDFQATIEKLRSLGKESRPAPFPLSGVESAVYKALQPMIESARFEEAISVGEQLSLTSAGESDQRELAKIALELGHRIREPEIRLKAYTLAVQILEMLFSRYPGSEEIARQLVSAKGNRSSVLGNLGRYDEQIAELQAIENLFEASQLWQADEWVSNAKYRMARRLGERGQLEREDQVYEEIHRRYSTSQLEAVRQTVALALRMRAVRLYARNEAGKAETVLRELERFVAVPPHLGTFDREMGWALLEKGVHLSKQARHEESLRCYDDLLSRFDRTAAPGPEDLIARARTNRANRLKAMNRLDEARTELRTVIDRFAASKSPMVLEVVKSARESLTSLDIPPSDVSAATSS